LKELNFVVNTTPPHPNPLPPRGEGSKKRINSQQLFILEGEGLRYKPID